MIIYKAVNKINGKIYIGQTVKSLSRRVAGHIEHSKRPFGMALRKYGLQSFEISVIDNATDKVSLNEKEKYWIKFCDCRAPNGYNLTDGGDGTSGWKPSQETLDKLKEAWTPERKKRNSERFTGDGNPMKNPETVEKVRIANTGKFVSSETKELQSIASKDKPKSESHKKHISEALMGHLVSDEVREAVRISRTGTHDSDETREKKRIGSIGHIVSEEACQRMREQRTGVPRPEEVKAKMRHPRSPEGKANIAASNKRRAEDKRALQSATLQ